MLSFYYCFVGFTTVQSHDIRDIVISHSKNRRKAPEIATLLTNKVYRSTIDRWLHRYKQSGSICVKPKSGRLKTARTKERIYLVKKRLDSNIWRTSLRTMAKDFKSSHRTIKRILNIDLNEKYYRKITVQSLKDDQKPIRKTCCQWIRKNIDRAKLERTMFTDKKVFTKNDYFNPKNYVTWADDRSVANKLSGLHSMEKYPVCVMVAVGATWYGLTRPYVILKDERLNGQSYHDQLLPFYKVEGERLFGHKNWGFQQDGASSHFTDKVQKWCRKNCKFFIPKEEKATEFT